MANLADWFSICYSFFRGTGLQKPGAGSGVRGDDRASFINNGTRKGVMMNDDIQSTLRLKYMIAAISLSCFVIAAIVLVTIFRPEHDNSGIITIMVSVGAGTYPGLMTFFRGQANSQEVQKVKADSEAKAEQVRLALMESQRRLKEATDAQTKHLEEQDAKLETVVRQTNGLIEEIKKAALKEGQERGEKVALEKLGIPDKRE